jgi:hypothetical protein
VIDVQELTLKLQDEGLSMKEIYWNHIYPKYVISESSFYAYLAENAKKKLKDMDIDNQIKLEL